MLYDKTYVEFYNGHRMPIVGLGTWRGLANEVKVAVKTALEVGYRHIDTAFAYTNEKAIGEALKEVFAEGKIRREDVFIVTKLPPNAFRAGDVERFLKMSLKNLQLDYVDLYLVHTMIGFQNVKDEDSFPRGPDGTFLVDETTHLVAIWKAMEQTVNLGMAKSIGISNWATTQIQRILDTCTIKPANIQVESNIYMQQNYLFEYCIKNGITLCAYAPIGSPGLAATLAPLCGDKVEFPNLMADPTVVSLAEKYKKEPPQILLRFIMQRGIAVIPKSINAQRIKSNFKVFDFAISEDDMKALKDLDRRLRMFDLGIMKGVENHPEYREVLAEDERIKNL